MRSLGHPPNILSGFFDTVAVALGCGLVGVGIGWLQGEIVAHGAVRTYQAFFAESAAGIGGVVAFFLGPILYHLFFGRQITLEQFSKICALSAAVGCLSAWVFQRLKPSMGWESSFVTPVAAVVLALSFARRWKRPSRG